MNYADFEIKKVVFGAEDYPRNLTRISKPPKQIYYRGTLGSEILRKTIAIVGTRMITNYGKQVVDEFVSSFVASGITTVSGFMYGVDTEVHSKTIEYGGRTVSVFGNGLDYIYPSENDKLYTRILESSGVVISEYKKDFKPQLWTYPARNRIVAGLATIGVLVIEADLDSGSMITASLAKAQGKKVWAIPGSITSKVSLGTNFLIKSGEAIMATSPSDILGKGIKKQRENKLELNDLETEIYAILERENLTIDEISLKLKKDIVDISSCLTMMGLKGMVNEVAGKFYLGRS